MPGASIEGDSVVAGNEFSSAPIISFLTVILLALVLNFSECP
jgi:hypothetical protein